jgi:hypothetical protein
LEVNSGSSNTNQAWTALLGFTFAHTVSRHSFKVQTMTGRTALLVEERTFL